MRCSGLKLIFHNQNCFNRVKYYFQLLKQEIQRHIALQIKSLNLQVLEGYVEPISLASQSEKGYESMSSCSKKKEENPYSTIAFS